ncbi:ABC transporter ATP-binding protein [Embleya sp. NPDC008237]|uniref:ABC transporter ATP-binding protein n=1 Tax=Embleya sp. NPDC008237 TaxID=3363978 RepID=UPI0036E9E092
MIPVRVTGSRPWAATALAVRAAKGPLAIQVALTVVSGALPVCVAWLTKLTLDGLVEGVPGSTMVGLGTALAVVGLVAGILPQVSHYVRRESDRRIGLMADERLCTAVNGFVGLSRFEDPAFVDRLRLARQGGGKNPGTVVDGYLGIVRALLTISGFLATLLVLSPLMTVLVSAAGVPTMIAEWALARRRARLVWTIGPTERREFFYGSLISDGEAAKELRLFGIGGFLRDRMLADRRTANAAKRALDRREVAVQSGLAALAAAASGAGLIWAVGAAHAGRLSVGGIVVFIAAVAGVQAAVRTLAAELARCYEAVLLFDHYRAVLDCAPDLPVAASPRALPALRRGIELRDVWFRYTDEHPWVLRGVDLWIPYGDSVALVGLNGAGKSTVVKLLCRMYDPTRGQVLWDGVDIRDVDPCALRERIGAVFQDFVSYDMTAAENIALGDLSVLEALDAAGPNGGDAEAPVEIRAAALRAGVHETVARLPHGYRTLLSRTFFTEADRDDPATGVMLSGGQSQRLALARAFLRDRRDLMILDEPSAGLDAEAEHEIHASLRLHRRNRTSVLVSHRLGAVREADAIVVLSGGRVVEQGAHHELLARDGEYARLFTLQAEGYRADEDEILTTSGSQPGTESLRELS